MAITPRTIFSSAAPATVAAVSLLAFTAVGTVAYMSSQECAAPKKVDHAKSTVTAADCTDVQRALGANQANWTEGDWIQYASCFERRDNAEGAVEAASEGLDYYPRSEPLYNMKGYHEIVLDEHAQAVRTLKRGLNRVGEPYSGVLENNLAWAALWAPREMDLDRARELYRSALDRESDVCAYLHTGLWVEYATAKDASGVERFEALREFDDLRTRYRSCLDRLDSADWKTVVEITGAAALYSEMEANNGRFGTAAEDGTTGDELLRDVSKLLETRFTGVTVDEVCREAMPVSTSHHTCVSELGEAMAHTKRTKDKSPSDIEPAAGSGGTPCPAMQ